MKRATVLLVATGGTIAMTPRADGAGVAPTLDAADLAAAVPSLGTAAEVIPVAMARKPSASLTLADLTAVAALAHDRLGSDADGAVIVQGTDTIEETAFVLSLLLPDSKPVVVTGAMRSPAMAGADGPANLLAAVTVAAAPAAHGLGPLVVLNDEIHAALLVQKGHTALTSAFGSPGFGPVGFVAEGRARIVLRPVARPPLAGLLDRTAADVLAILAAQATPPAVALLRIGLGDDGRLLAAAPDLGFAGVVIEGAGAGHVPEPLADMVSQVAARIPVILASRVSAGPVFGATYGYPGSEIDLLQRGVIGAGMLSGLKARLLLQLLLGVGADAGQIRAAFAAYDD
ncbi:L-asparaginase [Camelimonas fluminis]|uniref:Asparaginase n=1 Tax=Camelimonas fluminis TaxID=1576911 RepID=A0ABV7UNA3_9HYPH|nr:asparaginase [Camelimonas fluminis]GHE56342.1 L-asparaginase [Camelimonas fluminis]